MTSWIIFFYFFVLGAAMLLSVLGVWFTIIMPGADRWNSCFFRSFFIVLLLSSFIVLVELVLHYIPATMAVIYSVLSAESLFLSLPMLMLPVYLLHCCGESLRESKLFRADLLLWAAYAVLLLCAVLFPGSFSTITEDKLFYRGPLYPLILLPLIVMLLLNLAGAVHHRKQLTHKTFISFLAAILPMTVALFVHLFVDVFPLIDISTVVSGMSMYSLILSDQIEQDLRHQREIASQRASIMVLQMRPHFIYNTLVSIYCLCGQDPQKARQVTMDFTDYLRRNFNAVASENTIPFSAELEHTRAYLAVEQAQYEDMLLVEYDTQFTQFRLPPLTLQPIAENAVKHGMNPDAGPLHVTIRTRRTGSACVIAVEDNGPGFETAGGIQPHAALANIRQRLEWMCEGKLEITPRDGGGTVVTVTIPDRAAK